MSPYWDHPWFLTLMAKLLDGDRHVLPLLGHNPFPDRPPRYVRAQLYLYHFSPPGQRGVWWQRTLVEEYMPPLALRPPFPSSTERSTTRRG
jgi:hypothetical protein